MKKFFLLGMAVLFFLSLIPVTAKAQSGTIVINSTAPTPFRRGQDTWVQTTITNVGLPPELVVINFTDNHFHSFRIQKVQVWSDSGEVLCNKVFPCSVQVSQGNPVQIKVSFVANPPLTWYKRFSDGQHPTKNPDITMRDVGGLRVEYYFPYLLAIEYQTWYQYQGPYTLGIRP